METANEFPFAFRGSGEKWKQKAFHQNTGFRVTFDLLGQQQLTAVSDNCRNFQNLFKNFLQTLGFSFDPAKSESTGPPQTGSDDSKLKSASRGGRADSHRHRSVLAGTELVWLLGLAHTSRSGSWSSQEEDAGDLRIMGATDRTDGHMLL